jgi:DNA-directed RNA polymerase I subunit RPA49
VSTPGLAIPSSIGLRPYRRRRKNIPVRPRHSGGVSATELLLQSSEHPTIDYLGREEELGGTDSLLRHYVGVYDPTTGNLQVMEARKMVVRGTVRSQQAEPEAMAERSVLTVRFSC